MALEQSFEQVGVIPINTVLVGPIDADGQRGFSMQVHAWGTGGGARVQQSHDGIDWDDTLVSSIAGGPTNNPTSANTYWCNLVGRYVRVLMSTATTAGTTSFSIRIDKDEFSELPNGLNNVAVISMPATPAGTNLIGKSICDISATVANGPAFNVHRRVQSNADVNATSVKASAGRIARIWGRNNVASLRHLKLYNKASAPVVGTDIPYASLTLQANSEFNFDVQDFGLNFSTGIAYALTGGIGDTDTAALSTGDVLGLHILYI